MGTKRESGVIYAPYIPKFIYQETIEAKSRQINEWTFEQGPSISLHGYEIYTHIPMNDEMRLELSNIPFKFKLSPWYLAMWSISRSMQSEITKEIDADIVEALIQAYK